VTYVATLKGDVPGSPSPGAPTSQVVPGSWYGYPSILPVIATAPNWLEVRLAQRPNESTAWIPASDATVSKDHFAIVVDLTTMHLLVFKHGRPVDDFPAGIGRPSSPTPPGNFFVTMTVPPPSPGYGPLVLVTSDHSDTITDWDNSGDAIIAIHGPIDATDDALIGNTGAAVSSGCVRLHDDDLAELSGIPAGTPVDIVPS
jgi:lipoprotein-anchoring transpeptidase ErfK/SrfK